MMVARKICMIGDFSVGKTSLVARFVHSTFSVSYLTTVGVKVDTKAVSLAEAGDLKMVLWDIASTETKKPINPAYLRGTAGYLLIVDGTRAGTVDTARRLQAQVKQVVGDVPCVVIANKADLMDQWEIDIKDLDALAAANGQVLRTSAKTGEGVEAAFASLGRAVLDA